MYEECVCSPPLSVLPPSLPSLLLYTSVHLQEDLSLYEPGHAQGFFLLKIFFSATAASSGVRLWVSLKCLETIFIIIDAI